MTIGNINNPTIRGILALFVLVDKKWEELVKKVVELAQDDLVAEAFGRVKNKKEIGKILKEYLEEYRFSFDKLFQGNIDEVNKKFSEARVFYPLLLVIGLAYGIIKPKEVVEAVKEAGAYIQLPDDPKEAAKQMLDSILSRKVLADGIITSNGIWLAIGGGGREGRERYATYEVRTAIWIMALKAGEVGILRVGRAEDENMAYLVLGIEVAPRLYEMLKDLKYTIPRIDGGVHEKLEKLERIAERVKNS